MCPGVVDSSEWSFDSGIVDSFKLNLAVACPGMDAEGECTVEAWPGVDAWGA